MSSHETGRLIAKLINKADAKRVYKDILEATESRRELDTVFITCHRPVYHAKVHQEEKKFDDFFLNTKKKTVNCGDTAGISINSTISIKKRNHPDESDDVDRIDKKILQALQSHAKNIRHLRLELHVSVSEYSPLLAKLKNIETLILDLDPIPTLGSHSCELLTVLNKLRKVPSTFEINGLHLPRTGTADALASLLLVGPVESFSVGRILPILPGCFESLPRPAERGRGGGGEGGKIKDNERNTKEMNNNIRKHGQDSKRRDNDEGSSSSSSNSSSDDDMSTVADSGVVDSTMSGPGSSRGKKMSLNQALSRALANAKKVDKFTIQVLLNMDLKAVFDIFPCCSSISIATDDSFGGFKTVNDAWNNLCDMKNLKQLTCVGWDPVGTDGEKTISLATSTASPANNNNKRKKGAVHFNIPKFSKREQTVLKRLTHLSLQNSFGIDSYWHAKELFECMPELTHLCLNNVRINTILFTSENDQTNKRGTGGQNKKAKRESVTDPESGEDNERNTDESEEEEDDNNHEHEHERQQEEETRGGSSANRAPRSHDDAGNSENEPSEDENNNNRNNNNSANKHIDNSKKSKGKKKDKVTDNAKQKAGKKRTKSLQSIFNSDEEKEKNEEEEKENNEDHSTNPQKKTRKRKTKAGSEAHGNGKKNSPANLFVHFVMKKLVYLELGVDIGDILRYKRIGDHIFCARLMHLMSVVPNLTHLTLLSEFRASFIPKKHALIRKYPCKLAWNIKNHSYSASLVEKLEKEGKKKDSKIRICKSCASFDGLFSNMEKCFFDYMCAKFRKQSPDIRIEYDRWINVPQQRDAAKV